MMITPLELSGALLLLDFDIKAAGAPIVSPLADGRVLFKVNGEGSISSANWNGIMRSKVTEVNPKPPVYQGIAITFTIETDDGTIEGYYSGSIYHPTDGSIANINATGQILSVSEAYADLFLAEIIVISNVQFVDGRSVGETGRMTISPR